MKHPFRLLLTLTILVGGLSMTSCLNEENRIPPNCYDGILNNDEEGIDCGGPCKPCPPTCDNGVQDIRPDIGWVEEGVDCGGPCPACPTCFDGILNQDETGIDCGGTLCNPCPPICGNCINGIMDGDETGIDCGGACCPPCAGTGDCTNGIQDGNEEAIDCGGSCPPCLTNSYTCLVNGTFWNGTNGNAVALGTAISVSGADAVNGTLALNFGSANINNGNTIQFSPSTAPGRVAVYVVNIGGVDKTYTSAQAGASLNMTIQNWVPLPGGWIIATFSGTLVEIGGTATMQFTGGQISLPIN
jgi:hypothetical protein